MPRPKKTGRSRNYDPTPTEEWWLKGRAFPPMVPRSIQRELGRKDAKAENDETALQGLNWFEVLSLNHLERSGDTLERLRKLYEAAPASIRRRVPEVRREILESGPTPELVEQDRERTEKLQRETTWKSPWLNRWCRMSDEEQDEVVTASVRRRPEPLRE